ncbi:uncharacterized protein KQ657_004223 [Scheffersomyces spartinae]|uniref:Uncharacterized protein n=1 Tax=Scheffersomyces spartinae TaxID=45513 RepID=A0A9P8AJS9_9ASCO|nr:uncharacterized protein KQ657_004223 [Scheffersomyces spartinae]KAG7195106.1 hypothetical protein KQ657_004223 [Scheffersomyces spartinae]
MPVASAFAGSIPYDRLNTNFTLTTVIDLDHYSESNFEKLGYNAGEDKTSGKIYQVSEGNLKRMNLASIFESTDNTLVVKHTNKVIAYNEEENLWEEFESGEMEEREVSGYYPVSPVLDAAQASGSLSNKYSAKFVIGHLVAAALQIITFITTNTSVVINGSVVAHFTSTFTCNVPENHYGQLLMKPKYWSIQNSRCREVKYKMGKGIVPQLKQWKVIKEVKLLSLNMPTYKCKVEPNAFTDTSRQIVELDMNELY